MTVLHDRHDKCCVGESSESAPKTAVLIEFESVAQAIAAHDSAEYQEALRVLGEGAERDLRIVEGVE